RTSASRSGPSAFLGGLRVSWGQPGPGGGTGFFVCSGQGGLPPLSSVSCGHPPAQSPAPASGKISGKILLVSSSTLKATSHLLGRNPIHAGVRVTGLQKNSTAAGPPCVSWDSNIDHYTVIPSTGA